VNNKVQYKLYLLQQFSIENTNVELEVKVMYSLFGDSENRENALVRDLL
jgi:hypothetical protein